MQVFRRLFPPIHLVSGHLRRPDLPVPVGSAEHAAEVRDKRLQILGVGLQHPVLLHEVVLQLAQRVALEARSREMTSRHDNDATSRQ